MEAKARLWDEDPQDSEDKERALLRQLSLYLRHRKLLSIELEKTVDLWKRALRLESVSR